MENSYHKDKNLSVNTNTVAENEVREGERERESMHITHERRL